MTDAELLDLLARKSPDQLTLLELELLRRRFVESESLREELLAQRSMREYLDEALARIDLPLESLLLQFPRRASSGGRTTRGIAAAMAILLVLGGVAVAWKPPLLRTLTKQTAGKSPQPGEGEKPQAHEAPGKRKPDRAESAAAAVKAANSPSQTPPSKKEHSGDSSEPSASAASQEPNGAEEKPKPQDSSPVVPAGPWDDALRDEAPAAPFAQVAFQPFRTSKATPGKEELARWFTPMNAHAQIGERRVSVGNCGTINGLLRLNSPWREDAALRFAVEDYDRLKIHFFHGERGLTLAFYQGLNFAWAGYQTTRQLGSPQPDRYALAATDGGRAMRTEVRYGGPYDLRYRDGEMIFSRGDVALIRAPLAGPPSEVYFEGKAVFTGLASVKTQEFPFPPPHPKIETSFRPAELAWKEQLAEGAALQKHPDGAVELIAQNAKQRGFVAAPIPGEGLREIVLKIDAAAPGMGVFLGRGADGKPYEVVKFLRDQRTGKLGLSLHGDDDTHERHFEAVDERIAPLAAEPAWLRLLFGCGILRCWLSVDGVHWSEPFYEPRTQLPGNVTHLGLHFVANRPDCRLRLSEIRVRPLAAFNALVEDNLRGKALTLAQAADYGEWLTKVSGAQPPETDTAAWRRACAVNTLAAGCAFPLGDALVNALLDDAEPRLPVERQLALLEEAALLLDLRSDHNRLTQYLARYHRLGEQAYRAGDVRPFSLVRRAMMTAPVASPHQYRIGGERLIRAELLEVLDQELWPETLAFCEMLRFYRLDENLPVVAWARAAAQRQAPDQSAESPAEQREVWRHPLVEELSKDAYNFLAEFQALLDSEAFDEAARMIAATEPHAAAGVAADRRDPRLLISLPAAMRLALRDWAPLRQVMEERYADLAQLRVRRAISEGDEEGVRAVALQFDATPAAALAARWLGDRALSRGYFEQALSFYDRAERTADSALRAELAPRRRLAGAMLGREIGSVVSSEVELGDVRIAAAEFEAMVTQMRERAASSPETAIRGASSVPRVQEAPAPRGFTAQQRARLDGPAGDRPNELPRQAREGNVDWAARQLACVVEGDTLYVNNRFHVAAYDVNGGQRRWQSPAPPGKSARSHDWSLVPMRPLVTEKHIVTRQLTGDGPVLVCLDKQNGQHIWTSQPPPGEWLASDPLVVQGRLLLLRVRSSGAREASLVLCDYDSATGEPRDQQELLRLREPAWTARYVCQAAVADDALVVALGGCVVCADLAGGVRWVRRQLYLPPDEDPTWAGQHHEPPLVDAHRVYLAQPGVRAIECVDADTGRSHWTRVLPDVQRLVGLAEVTGSGVFFGPRGLPTEKGVPEKDSRPPRPLLIVETADGFLALAPEDGQVVWRHEAADRLEGRLCGGSGGLLYVRRRVGERDDTLPRPEFVWINPQTGQEQASCILHDPKRAEIKFGPLVAHKDRLWTFVGAGPQDPHRDVVELIPQGEATPPAQLADDAWLNHFPPAVQSATARVLPDWRVFRGIADKPSGFYAELHGERDVFSLNGTRNQPVVLARYIAVPQGRARLRLRLAMEQLRASHLHVEFRGESLWEQKLDDQTLGSRQWRDFEADLSPRAGQTGWLTVRLSSDNDERFTSFWKRLEVAF